MLVTENQTIILQKDRAPELISHSSLLLSLISQRQVKILISAVTIILLSAPVAISQEIIPLYQMERGRPGHFPVPPRTEKSLFFIQRNKNRNTIVYDAILTENGTFNRGKPMDAYWLRYATTGERMELTWIQRKFAYGYNARSDPYGSGYYVTLTAYDKRKIHLQMDTKGKPVATLSINGKYCRLDYIWVYAEEINNWPKVLHVDLVGRDMISGKTEVERIFND